MIVKEYEDASKFINDYEAIMLEQEALSQLVLYSAYQFQNPDLTNKLLFGAVLHGETTILLFCNVLPQNLILYAVTSEHLVEATLTVADFLYNQQAFLILSQDAQFVRQSLLLLYRVQERHWEIEPWLEPNHNLQALYP